MSCTDKTVIRQTKKWLEEIVIGLQLCPFAEPPFQQNSIAYSVNHGTSTEQHLQQLADSFNQLDTNADIATSLLIYPDAYQEFNHYLDLLDYTNHLLDDLGYSGVYQIASFHPDYCFAGNTEDDASNFSNRSPYPMLHLIREDSLERAIASYADIEQVPENNIKKLRKIGFLKMQEVLRKIKP